MIIMLNPENSQLYNLSSPESEIFEKQAAILNEQRLAQKLIWLNQLAAAVLRSPMPDRNMLQARTKLKGSQVSPLIGYLQDYKLIEYLSPRIKNDPCPGHYAAQPPLCWAATKPETYPHLAWALSTLPDLEAPVSGNL